MKHHESAYAGRLVVAILALVGLCASCTSGSSVAEPLPTTVAAEVIAATVEDEVAPTVVEAESDPTPTAVPVAISDEDRIAAAYAAFDADPEPAELIAWDFSEPRVNDAGLVSFSVCGWDGQGVFDQVYAAVYETSVDDDGAVATRRRDVAIGAGECLNTALIDSVFEFINDVDVVLATAFEAPGEFAVDAPSVVPFDSAYLERLLRSLEESASNQQSARHTAYGSGTLPDSAVLAPVWRRYRSEPSEILEVAACREMHPEYGIYRDGVRIDDRKGDDLPGPHSISAYVIGRDAARNSWVLREAYDGVWGDCGDPSDTSGFLDRLVGSSTSWQELR